LWALPFVLLVAWRGRGSLHSQEYLFFTQAALATFGGAYAVLAYVTQAAAGHFGWIAQAQAVDGLALAETTPGPLIMVLQFVGFMAT
jgi:chromate transporter